MFIEAGHFHAALCFSSMGVGMNGYRRFAIDTFLRGHKMLYFNLMMEAGYVYELAGRE